jgi:two-component system response regulator HydG
MAMAEGGTIFLDEVGELPVDLQAKLLRAIQEKEIRPVGSTRRLPINIRILAATNRDLEHAVMQGEFRRDLYFRLNVLSLRIPPLRERRQDIPLLIGHFLDRMTRTSGLEKILSDEALKAMLAYDWPGNVRELENCLERTYAFTSGPLIHTTDLPREVANLPLPDTSDGNEHDSKRDYRTQWRQTASCPSAGHRQDNSLPQAERLCGPRISILNLLVGRMFR